MNMFKKIKSYFSIFIFLPIILIFVYKLYNMIIFGLSSDELFSVGISTHILSNGLFPIEFKHFVELNLNDTFMTWKAADQSPILYESVLAIWLLILGDTDVNAKLLSLIFFLISIVFSYKYLLKDESFMFKVTFFCFMIFTPVLIAFSVEARTYMMVFMFSIFLLYQIKCTVLTNGIHLKSNKNILINFVLLLFISFSHYYGFILAMIILMMYVYLIFKSSLFDKKYLLFLVIPLCVISYIIFFNKLGVEYASSGNLAWSTNLNLFSLTTKMFEVLYGVIGTSMLFCIFIMFAIFSYDNKENKLFDILSIIFLLYTLVYIALTLKNGTYHIRHYIFILPFIFFIFSYIVDKDYKYFIVISIILSFSFVNLKNYPFTGHENYKKAGLLVSEEFKKSNNEINVITTWCPNQSFYYYYLKNDMPKNKISCINTLGDFKNHEKTISNPFIIEAHVGHKPLIDLILEDKEINCKIEQFENINVYLCKKEKE